MTKEKNQAKLEIGELAKIWDIDVSLIKKMGKNLTVGGSLYLRGTAITALPDNLTVGGSLDLQGTAITALPDNLTVGGYLDLRGTAITALPDNLTVGGYLDLQGTAITALPDNLTVGGYLYLQGTAITVLPDNLTVGGSLDLRGTAITALPDNLTVGGYLDLRGTAITEKEKKKVNKSSIDFGINLSLKLRALVEFRFNARGYSISDGILAKILSSKGNIKKIRVVGQKKDSYLIQDENGNSAHGDTIKQAREDLIYKAVAKFDGAIPKSAMGKEWVGIYRAVTGACAAGVKNFVDKTGKSLDDTYTAKEIAELVKGNYGADKFAEKVNAV